MGGQERNFKYLQWLLLPLARFCLRKGYAIQHFVRVAKVVFAQAAEEELRRSGEKVNVSRISALSGLTRDEVARITRSAQPLPQGPVTLLGRVLAQWEQDSEFTTGRGQPRQLTFAGDDSEFHRLVSRVSKHLNPGTVLFELERIGVVEKRGSRVRRARQLLGRSENPEDAYRLLAAELDSLIQCVDENVWHPRELSNLHVRTEYDNIYLSSLPEIRRWLIDEGKAFHRKVRDYLSSFDRDVSSEQRGDPAGGRVVVSVFSVADGAEDAQQDASDAA